MSHSTVISVDHVSKAYRMWESPSARLTSPLQETLAGLLPEKAGIALRRHAARQYRDFYALKNVSLEVRNGESVGIIGRNGSGKSTLLQIITGTLQPTSGSVQVRGRIAALLELGSGFNPEFTGRENVYLNGTVLGLSPAEIDAKFDSIASFADVGPHLDHPLKTYSSGMAIRLAFAVATCVEPELLIIDEALSVGDVFFQQKCFKRIRQMLDGGTSLLFVSHDTAAVQNLCDRAILLVNGSPAFDGPPEEAASRYFAISSPASQPQRSFLKHQATVEKHSIEEKIIQYDVRQTARAAHGAQQLEILRVAVLDASLRQNRTFPVGGVVLILFQLYAHTPVVDPSCGIHLFDRMNNLVFASGSRQMQASFADFAEGETRCVEFRLELNVQPGEYTFSVGCAQRAEEGPNAGYVQHRLEGLGPITVVPLSDGVWPFYGIAKLPLTLVVHG